MVCLQYDSYVYQDFSTLQNFPCLYVLNVNHEIIIKCCALCKIARNMYDEIYNSVELNHRPYMLTVNDTTCDR